MTIEQVERDIGPLVVGGGPAAEALAVAWAMALYFLAGRAIETVEWRPTKTLSAAPRGSKKGVPPRAGLGERASTANSVARLRQLGPNRRLEIVRLEHHEFRGPAIAEALLEQALRSLPADPEEAARWAECAGLAAGNDKRHYCQHEPEQAALGLRADLYQANALRCRGEFDAADTILLRAIKDAHEVHLREPTFWAEAKWFLASLRRAQRRFPEALCQAHLAAALWKVGGLVAREVISRWQLATLHDQIGEPSAALAAIQQAAALVQRIDEPELGFGVRHAEVFYLARGGHFNRALTAYLELEREYLSRPHYEAPRFWALALIASGLGRFDEAEARFREARERFLSNQNSFDAALVTLDWSVFLMDRNRPDEVLPLAVFMGQAFETLGVPRETLASWAIFRAAAERQQLTRAVAQSMIRTLGEERTGTTPRR